MDSLQTLLRQELKRLTQLAETYLLEIEQLPKGSIQLKKIKGKKYVYRVWSVQSKLHYQYLGNLTPDEIDEKKRQVKSRKEFQKKLKAVQKDLARIRKVVQRV